MKKGGLSQYEEGAGYPQRDLELWVRSQCTEEVED